MSPDISDMDRRGVLKRGATLGAVALAGAGGAVFMTDDARAADTKLEATSPSAVTTDGGDIEYVAYGGRLRFQWDGLDTDAVYGQYTVESRINTGSGYGSWHDHGTGSGPLGDDPGSGNSHDGDGKFEEGEQNTGGSWGGSNDSNSGQTSNGFFQFKYGDEYNNTDYVIAGSGGGTDAKNQHPKSAFESDTDGEKQDTKVQMRFTCSVWDADPSTSGASKLIETSDTAAFKITVNNEKATATTGGEVNGEVGV